MNQAHTTFNSPATAYNSVEANRYPQAPFGARLTSLALAVVFTLGTLSGIAGLASLETAGQPSPAQMAEQMLKQAPSQEHMQKAS